MLPKALRADLPPETGYQQPNHGDLDQRLARLDLALEVFTHATIPREPCECAFHDPPFGKHVEASCAWRTCHDFQVPVALLFAPVGQFLATIGSISPDFLEAWDEEFQPRQEPTSTLGVVHVGGRDVDGDRQTQRVDEQVPLAPLHAFVRVKTANVC